MQKIVTIVDLKNAIEQLEAKRANELSILKVQFLEVGEILKPANIIQNTIKKIITTPDLRGNAINAVFGLATGAVATKLFMGKVSNPVSKLVVGAIMGMATSAGASKAVAGMKSIGGSLLNKLFRKKPSEEHVEKFM